MLRKWLRCRISRIKKALKSPLVRRQSDGDGDSEKDGGRGREEQLNWSPTVGGQSFRWSGGGGCHQEGEETRSCLEV